tara:strand:- start:1106 stop:1780 length:675 start_codon:yes stop_codon:yes gene_type:complete
MNYYSGPLEPPLYDKQFKRVMKLTFKNPKETARYKGFFAYEAMKEKIKFHLSNRKDIFLSYRQSLSHQDFILFLDDMANFIEWHKEMYSADVHFVYTFFKELDDQLIPLYVGKTKNLKTRITAHSEKQWFLHASRLAIEPHYFDGDATVRESRLIRKLKPLFNRSIDGFSMSFPKDEIAITVPKENDVSTYNIAPPEIGVKHFQALGAVTDNVNVFETNTCKEG